MKLLLQLALAAALAAPALGSAQGYPTKPIRWVVPYTAGGITDIVTRVVTNKMSGGLGQNIIVDNRPGANSILGADIVAKSAPDGYTILTVIAAHAANHTLYAGKLPFDPQKAFTPISLIGIAPLIPPPTTISRPRTPKSSSPMRRQIRER
jgi:tripartite-type tricarboxylate transporter receptor subunit TctC